ncbi:MAG TPA: SpoIIE family protein phosphatase [Verrucomicrobiae bacterium]|jgi:sigma-B regulation protein RsbU (phosphoserine phosphatase)
MESDTLKILFIGPDEQLSRNVSGLLNDGEKGSFSTAPTVNAALSRLAQNSVDIILFEFDDTKDGFDLLTLLAVQAPKMPIIVLGPGNDDRLTSEIVHAGAQDCLPKDKLDAPTLHHAIRSAIERQSERVALLQEKENYYGVFDHLVEGIFRTTPDGHYLLANVAIARIYGYDSPAELMASITDIARRLYVEEGRREEFVRMMQKHDTLNSFESRIYRKDDTIIWISENCRAVRDVEGKLLYYEGTVSDITDRRLAENQVRRATAELSRSREELRAKNQQMEDNLRMAREIQSAMLPQQYPVFPAKVTPEQSAFQFAHRYQPAETVSGDFFSVSQLSDDEVGVLICDVTGHGIRAALVTAMIRALAEELKPLARDPGMFLRKLNSDLCSILKSTGSPTLTTAFYLATNWRTGVMRFANAGHPKPLLVRRSENSVRALANASGHGQPALGLFDDPPYQTTEIALKTGDLIMLFTDGLYEVQGANEEIYSQQRLMVDIKDLIEKPTNELFDKLLDAVRNFSINHEFEDDVCLVGMEIAKGK